MTTVTDRKWDHHFWTVGRAVALLIFLVGIGSSVFWVHNPNTALDYSHAHDRDSVIIVAGNVYDGVELGPQRTGLPVPASVTVADMRANYKNNGWRVHVFVHGTNIMVTFPKGPPVCVWVPVIVDGPKEPRIVSC
jgi:hypothetical protein